LANIKPMLSNQWAWLYGMMAGSDHRPTNSAFARFNDLAAELDGHLAELRSVFTADVAAFNALVGSRGGGPVIVPRMRETVTSEGGSGGN
jgi:hypothetical protein